ncbi:MAG: hypothetical protein IKS35_08825 [Clostridia bacterium]|nr:hypothetical protein [Clostridia bacterium]
MPDCSNPFAFDGTVPENVLRAYLSRAATLTVCEPGRTPAPGKAPWIGKFIAHTGVKYVCRFACAWTPSALDEADYPNQKILVDELHAQDPDLILEACLFEHITKDAEGIEVAPEAFRAYGLPVEKRNFRYLDMVSPYGLDFWRPGQSVPDITKTETQLFFYTRAMRYIDMGYEAFHLGQVYLIGRLDAQNGYACYTDLCNKIHAYAKEHARRHTVLLNAHIHGITGTDGKLLLDFHMWPARFRELEPTPECPMPASVFPGYLDSIYGDSLGGLTHFGWSCAHLPYLVEIDNWGCDIPNLGKPDEKGYHVWGYDDISWFANQTRENRARILMEISKRVRELDPDGYFAMPGERIAYIHDADKVRTAYYYFAYAKDSCPFGMDDEDAIARVLAARPVGD